MANRGWEHIIEVPGVRSELQSRAKEDIGLLVDAMAVAANAQGLKFLLSKIRVTDHFEHDVNGLPGEHSGLAGHAAARQHAQAIGKTLWTRSQQGELGFVVLIDAKLIGSWDLKNPLCLTTVLHELVHVLYEERRLQRLGEDEYTAVADTRERWLDGWATFIAILSPPGLNQGQPLNLP